MNKSKSKQAKSQLHKNSIKKEIKYREINQLISRNKKRNIKRFNKNIK